MGLVRRHELLEIPAPFDFSLAVVGQADLPFLFHFISIGVAAIRSVLFFFFGN